VVPDSSVFIAIKPVRTTYSYKQAICQQFEHHSRTDKACRQGTAECMTEALLKIGLYLNNIAARNHDRLSRINHDEINKSEA
jgi:hypothetical protein